uniref:SRR1-like protein n=1 Tax=Lygus hesperus TaxID=30085 RepID=A0A0A9Y542_LYGHE
MSSNVQNILVFNQMDGFTKVKKKSRRKHHAEEFDETSELYFDKLCRRVDCTVEQFQDDDLLSETIARFENALSQLGTDVNVQCIVCYGLGSVSNSKSSLYQFALIHQTSLKYGIPLSVYDPVFTAADIKLFKRVNCTVLPLDDVGVREVKVPTLFFTPHAPRIITDNILRSNWGLSLSNCILFGDDLSKIIDNTPTRIIANSFPFINECQHFVEVIPLENKFKYSDVFNDLAFHVFVPKKLTTVDPQTWEVDAVAAKASELSESS